MRPGTPSTPSTRSTPSTQQKSPGAEAPGLVGLALRRRAEGADVDLVEADLPRGADRSVRVDLGAHAADAAADVVRDVGGLARLEEARGRADRAVGHVVVLVRGEVVQLHVLHDRARSVYVRLDFDRDLADVAVEGRRDVVLSDDLNR